jgi:hypothetical protein
VYVPLSLASEGRSDSDIGQINPYQLDNVSNNVNVLSAVSSTLTVLDGSDGRATATLDMTGAGSDVAVIKSTTRTKGSKATTKSKSITAAN